MIEYSKGIVPLFVLGPDEELTAEHVDKVSNQAIIMQGSNIFRLKSTGLVSYLSSVDKPEEIETVKKIVGLKTHYDTNLVYLLKDKRDEIKFPIEEMRYTMRYFQAIYDEHGSEAAVLLLFKKSTLEWKVLLVPQISAAGGSVVYAQPVKNTTTVKDQGEKRIIDAILNDDEAKEKHLKVCEEYERYYAEGFRIYGTIHSHCNFNAYHSGVDDADEIDFDGLHITIGNVRSGWSYSCRYMFDGVEFKTTIEDILQIPNTKKLEEGIEEIEIDDFHMSLMMPKLLRQTVLAVQPERTSDKTITFPYWNEEPPTLFSQPSIFEMVEEDKTVRLVSTRTGKVFIADYMDYYNNRAKYRGFTKISDRPTGVVKDTEVVDFDTLESVTLLNVPALNPSQEDPSHTKATRMR